MFWRTHLPISFCPFNILIASLINFVHGSYKDELEKFYKALHRFEAARLFVAIFALTKARMKVKFQACVGLSQNMISYFRIVSNRFM